MGWRRGKYNGGGFSPSYKPNRNYDDGLYKRFRKEVRKRDNNTCQMPGCNAKKTLQVHHILRWADSPHLRYEPRNGILLCKYHHELIKNQEEHYISLFTNIIARKYKNDNNNG